VEANEKLEAFLAEAVKESKIEKLQSPERTRTEH
jgi:hypothetical protein